MKVCFVIIALFFLHLQDRTSMHSTFCNLCSKNGAKIRRKSVKGRKKRSCGSDFVVLFTSAGRDAVARVHRATLISRTSERGQVSLPPPSSPPPPPTPFLVTYRFTFLWVNVREPYADARAGYRVGRRIKPGFYYKRIQIPRTRSSPRRAEAAERREEDRDRDIKNCPREPRESARGVSPYKPRALALAYERILFRTRIKISIRPSLLLSNVEYFLRGRIFYSSSIWH